jgi:hypothetical protein
VQTFEGERNKIKFILAGCVAGRQEGGRGIIND